MFSFPAPGSQAAASPWPQPGWPCTPHTHTPCRHCWPPQGLHKHKNRHHTHTNSTCTDKPHKMGWVVHMCWLISGIKASRSWPQTVVSSEAASQALTLPLDTLDTRPSGTNSQTLCSLQYLAPRPTGFWNYPPAPRDWRLLALHTQKTENKLNQENN